MAVRADASSESMTRFRREQLHLGAQGWVRRRAPAALATPHDGGVAAVLPLGGGGESPELRRLAADLRLECAGAAGGEVSVGGRRPKPGIAGVRTSDRQARPALAMGGRLFGRGRGVT